MNTAQHLWSVLKGRKTYLVSLSAVIYAWGVSQGIWQHSTFVDTLLAAAGAASLRNAINTNQTPPKP